RWPMRCTPRSSAASAPMASSSTARSRPTPTASGTGRRCRNGVRRRWPRRRKSRSWRSSFSACRFGDDALRSALARVAQHHRHPLEQLPADHAVLLDERAEVPVGQAVAGEIARRHDRRKARALVDQRDLAEIIARLQGRALLAADEDGRFAGFNDEKRRPARALLDERLALGEAALLEQARDALQLAP